MHFWGKLFYIVIIFGLTKNYFNLGAEPFLSPHNPFLRHEIRLLQDIGSLDEIMNTWPLNLGGLSVENNQQNWGHDLLGDEIRRESRKGWTPLKSKIGVSDEWIISRSFGNEPRGQFNTGLETSWMNDRFAAKLSLLAYYGVEADWKGRKDEGLNLDGSYIAARLGNWSVSLGKVDRWWGPGWDGSLILSTNARPIPAVSFARRIAEPFENKWLSWIGPWTFSSFIGKMEEERTIPNPFLWGMRSEFNPTILDGLEIGVFRMIQLGGQGRPEGFSTWVDAFLSQDNYGANTGSNDLSKEPGNQLAGIDFRWKVFDLPFAVYGQVVGEDEDKFLPNSLMFQYGMEGWKNLGNSTLRVFAEYADLTSYWWTGDPRTRNISYNHHIYRDGYRYYGRPVGHWADTDSQIISFGGLLLNNSGIGWGTKVRVGDLNKDGVGSSSVSNRVEKDYFSVEIFNSRNYNRNNIEVYCSLGWEDCANKLSPTSSNNLTYHFSLIKTF